MKKAFRLQGRRADRRAGLEDRSKKEQEVTGKASDGVADQTVSPPLVNRKL